MFSIGVDLGGTKIRVGLMDGQGTLRFDEEIPTLAERGPNAIITDIVGLVQKARAGAMGEEIVGVGIGSPGPLNPKTGLILSPPNLPGWTQIPLRQMISDATGLTVYLENDANVACLAEHRFGAGRGTNDMVYFTVSTGIGGGAVVENRLVQGAIGAAAEFGHMVVDLHGPLCRCGNRGCLEAVSSGTAIGRIASHRLQREVTAGEVAALADNGDAVAIQVLEEAFYALGVGVANIITAFDPEMVVIGGGVTQIGAMLFNRVRQVAATQSFRDKSAEVPIMPAELHRNSGVMGAAAVPFSMQSM